MVTIREKTTMKEFLETIEKAPNGILFNDGTQLVLQVDERTKRTIYWAPDPRDYSVNDYALFMADVSQAVALRAGIGNRCWA